ncbi:hypothetical protein [Luteococcus sp. OSA5]|uniref:hypothetical protein n=1 Tax=Luteococcus sp. OSA5 TaxID=3401630 RepID=UPI003B4348A3
MTFENLPDDWSRPSLADPDLLTDVVDLLMLHHDRVQGTVLALLADDELRLLQPVHIDDVPVGCDAYDQHRLVNHLVSVLKHLAPHGGLGLGIGRRGMVVQTQWDQTWRRALALACQEQSVTDLGCCLATPIGVVRLDDDVAAA